MVISVAWVPLSCEELKASEIIQNENICLYRESNQRPLAFQAGALNHWTTLAVNELLFKLLHYLGIWLKSTYICNVCIKLIILIVYWKWL